VLDTLACLDRGVDACKGDWVPSDTILLDDWEALADFLPSGYTQDVVDRLSRQLQESSAAEAGTLEKPKRGRMSCGKNLFLAGLNGEQLRQLVEAIKRAGCPPFTHLKPTLEIKKDDAKALSQIMSHVVAWVNPCPSDVKRTGNNKPPLCKDLEPAFRDNIHSSTAAAEITQMSTKLERDVLEHALSLPKELGRLGGPILEELPTGDAADNVEYASRFTDSQLWQGILEIVRHYLGPGIRPEWVAGQQQDHGAGEAKEGSQELIKRGVVTLAEYIPNIQEIDWDALVQDGASLTRLGQMLGQTIETWLAKRDGVTPSSSQQHQPAEKKTDQRSNDEGKNPAHLLQIAKLVDIWDQNQRPEEPSRRASIRSSPLEMYGSRHAARIPIPSSFEGGDDLDKLVILPPLRDNSKEAFCSPGRSHYSVVASGATARAPRKKLPTWATKGPIAK
jgi:hypothetical protein